MNWFLKRRWRVALWMGGVMVLAGTAIILPPLIRSSDTLAEKNRYASICTRCGEQTAEDFYMILGTEVLRCEKVLRTGRLTKISGNENCQHEVALIGRSFWQLHKNFDFGQLEYGRPQGWTYRGEDLSKHLARLATMRPGESTQYIDELTALQTNAHVSK